MAGYAKVWTTIWNDGWFKSLTCLQRGIWLQLISYAKLMGDTGAINLRNFREFSLIFGLDDSTGAKNLRKFAEVKKIDLKVDQNGLFIFIRHYEDYQRVMKPEDIRAKAKSLRKIPEKSPLTEPDRTRQNNSKSDKSDTTQTGHQEFVKYWCDKYQDEIGIKYKFDKSKDGQLVKTLLSTYGYATLCRLADQIFVTPDEWIAKAGISIGILSSQSNKLAQEIAREENKHGIPETTEERLVREIIEGNNQKAADTT